MRHGRSFPIKPHLAPAIVGAPVVVWLAPPAVVISQQAKQCAVRVRNGPRLHPRLPPAIIGAAPPPPAVPVVTRPYITGQAVVRARQAWGNVGPISVTAPPIVATSYARAGRRSRLVTIRPGIEIDA